jgi:hypothetical protein
LRWAGGSDVEVDGGAGLPGDEIERYLVLGSEHRPDALRLLVIGTVLDGMHADR